MVKILLLTLGLSLVGCTVNDDPVSDAYLNNRIIKSEDGCVFLVHVGLSGCKFLHFRSTKSDPTCPLLKIKSQPTEDEQHGEEEGG